jgi:RNA polymerase sigma-70 factor, ECF subfamily
MLVTDDDILRGLRDGNTNESMRALLQTHGGGVYGFALSRLRDPGLAEEVVQEVMVRVWRHADELDPGRGSLRSWIYRIASHVVIDAHRRRSARVGLALHDAPEPADGEEPIEREMLVWQLRAAMARLRPEHREVIRLIHFEGMKLREVAEVLGVPLGTVKSRCFYALESLRLVLEEQGLVE